MSACELARSLFEPRLRAHETRVLLVGGVDQPQHGLVLRRDHCGPVQRLFGLG